MDSKERFEWIQRARYSADRVATLTVEAPDKAIDFRPDFPEAWTIREHLAHLADGETVAVYFRVRLALAQPGATALLYEEEEWRRLLHYSGRDPAEALTTFLALREETLRVLEAEIGADWDAAHFIHPQKGQVSLADFIPLIAGHSDFHIPYIERNLSAFYREPEAEAKPTES